MKVNIAWLKEWINIPFDAATLAEKLTLSGLESTVIESDINRFSDVIVGEIIQVTPHPKADRLQLCSVNCGQSIHNIVCGATNVRKGLKVATAIPGATLTSLVIQPRTIRGVRSEGMLCSLAELGLSALFPKVALQQGIWELPCELTLGTDLWERLGVSDALLHIQVPPNRGDCLSIAGLARELSILYNFHYQVPPVPQITTQVPAKISIDVEDPAACPCYAGRVIQGLNANAPIPWYMIARLHQAGMRTINSIVDILNYAMIEWGAPLHAFDLHTLSGPLTIRKAKHAETLHLLNDKRVTLKDSTLVVADQNTTVAMAGIMGGTKSAVTGDTVSIFLESAFFTPDAILGQPRQYGLSTEAGYRFERGVDPILCKTMLDRVTNLLIHLCGGQAGPLTSQESTEHFPTQRAFTLDHTHIKKLLGIEITVEATEKCLTALGMRLLPLPRHADKKEGQQINYRWQLKSPSWRFDIKEAVDIIEELARMVGYDKISSTLPTFPLVFKEVKYAPSFKQYLLDQGYYEVVNYSFTSAPYQRLLDPERTPVAIVNPISQDMNVLRTQLWAGLLTNLAHNQNHLPQSYKFFEQGTVFTNSPTGIVESTHVGGIVTGYLYKEQWGRNRHIEFFDIKQTVQNTLATLHPAEKYSCQAKIHPALHPAQTAQLHQAEEAIGWVGALHPSLYSHFKLSFPVYLFEWKIHPSYKKGLPCFKNFARFPYIRRDLSFWIRKDIPFDEIKIAISGRAGTLLKEISLFDVYEATDKPKQRSLALSLLWQHPERTLTDGEIDKAQAQVIEYLQQLFHIQLRQQA